MVRKQIRNTPKRIPSFAQRQLIDITDAARISGFSQEHLRRLCRGEKIEHTRRGVQYFFTAPQINKIFRFVPARPA